MTAVMAITIGHQYTRYPKSETDTLPMKYEEKIYITHGQGCPHSHMRVLLYTLDSTRSELASLLERMH